MTFLLLLAWSAISGLGGGGLVAAFFGLLFMVAVFASVFLHELGHALTARVFGIGTHQILLTPLGGVAEIEGSDLRPREEMLIALAGPAVSLGLGGVLMLVASSMGTVSPVSFLGALAWANLLIGVFNLLPAFPMDGGRVLRSWLAMRMDYVRATGIAATVGRYAAIGIGVYGLFYSPMLVALALFVFLAGSAEARGVARRAAHPPTPSRFAQADPMFMRGRDARRVYDEAGGVWGRPAPRRVARREYVTPRRDGRRIVIIEERAPW